MVLPNDFLKNIEQQVGEIDAFLNALATDPPISIRLNQHKKIGLGAVLEQVKWHPQGYYLAQRPVFTLDPSFHAGAYYVQEASSMFLLEMLRQNVDLQQPLKVLDLCAAPGGKSTLLASAISPDSFLLANEVIKKRVDPLLYNLEKWGTANYVVSNHDPADFSQLKGFFDVVVVDAPCSGEGLFRKDANAVSEWSPEHVGHCAVRQQRILKEAIGLVAEGGLLVYSTCTYNHLENDRNLQWLLENGHFDTVHLAVPEDWGITKTQYGYQFYPHRLKGEGFFIAGIRKKWEKMNAPLNDRPGKDLKPISKKELPIVSEWVEKPADFEFLQKPNNEVVAIPKTHLPYFFHVANALKRRSSGLAMGVLKNKKFIPSHTLALSIGCNNSLPSLELDKDQALLYLKKEPFALSSEETGWHLVKYQGNNLGWVKMLGNRFNNYLPTERRIRMDLR